MNNSTTQKLVKRPGFALLHINGGVWQYKTGKSFTVIFSPCMTKYCIQNTILLDTYEEAIEVSVRKHRYQRIDCDDYAWSCGTYDDPLYQITPAKVKDYIISNLERRIVK